MESIVQKLVKKFNSDHIIKFSEKDAFKDMKSWAHTGSPSLDFNLHTFGFPQNIIEIAGPSRGGKTTLALMGMKNFQKENKENGVCVILSSENRDNLEYANSIGIDVENVLIVKITFVEEMFMLVKQIIDASYKEFKESNSTGVLKFYFIWDSLGGTLSLSEKNTMDENNETLSKKMQKGELLTAMKSDKIASFAKEAKKFAKYIMAEMYDKIIHFVILNHTYDTISPMGISKKKSTGGEWIEFFPTLRLYVSQIQMEKVDDVEVSQITKVKVVKNDFNSRMSTEIRILLGYGVILSEEDIEYALEHGILVKESAKKISFLNGKLKWSSMREFFNLYYERNKFLIVLHNKIKESMQEDLLKIKSSMMNK